MRISKLLKGFAVSLVLGMMLSMTAFAEGETISLVSIEQEESEEGLVYASRESSISPYPTLDDAIFSNNTKIELQFLVTSFGTKGENYEIAIYRGEVKQGNFVDRHVEDFPSTAGVFTYTFELDTTNLEDYPHGEYIIVCTSYRADRTVSSTESITITLEDYKLVQDRAFVSRLYRMALGRDPEEEGLEDWSQKLYDGRMTGAEVVNGIFGSQEMAARNLSNADYVELLYNVIFERSSDKEGKQNWLNYLEGIGVSRTYVLKGFSESQEFKNLCARYYIIPGTLTLKENRDKNLQVTSFVNRLYLLALERLPDAAGINNWTGLLLDKKSGQTPKSVAHGFVFGPEMTNRGLSNEDFVLILYRLLLEREADEHGLADWTGQLDAGTANRVAIFNGFADSPEFQNLVKKFGL